MKQIKKSLAIFMSIFMLATIIMYNGTFSTKAKASEVPVKLYYAKLISEYSGAAGHTEGYIAVKNLSYNKNVTIHYSFDNGASWQDTPAAYYKTNTDGYEVWKFTTSSAFCSQCIFCIKYEVNGQIYWDNNNGNNYSMKVGRIAFGKSSLATFAFNGDVTNGMKNVHGSICIKNISTEKVVKVRITEDNWKSYKDIDAQYSYSDSFSDNEVWSFNYSTSSNTSQIQFAVYYQANSAGYWDNNFGSNYIVNY